MSSWSALPSELKTRIIEAYVDNACQSRPTAYIYYSLCPENTCHNTPVEISLIRNECPGAAAETTLLDLYDLYDALPEALQQELVRVCAAKLDTVWTTAVRTQWHFDMGRTFHVGLFLLKMDVTETMLFELEAFESILLGEAVALYLKQPCPVHQLSAWQFESVAWLHPDRGRASVPSWAQRHDLVVDERKSLATVRLESVIWKPGMHLLEGVKVACQGEEERHLCFFHDKLPA